MGLGYLDCDSNGRLHLQPRIVALSHAYLSATPLATAAQPVLDKLSADTGLSCNLAVLDRDHIVYLVRGASSRVLHPAFNTGRRLAACYPAIGLMIMAHWPAGRLDRYLAETRLVRHPRFTVSTVAELKAALAQALRDGFAIADRQLSDDFAAVAVPVMNDAGEVIAGVNAIFAGGTMTTAQIVERYVEPLQAVAGELRGKLHYPTESMDGQMTSLDTRPDLLEHKFNQGADLRPDSRQSSE